MNIQFLTWYIPNKKQRTHANKTAKVRNFKLSTVKSTNKCLNK